MGSVMSYALGLGPDRPAPAGILAFSGFVPTVEGWQPALAGRERLRAFIAHGRNDPIMDVSFARSARDLLEAAGLPVEYHESDAGHHIDPAHVPAAVGWLRDTLPAPFVTAQAASPRADQHGEWRLFHKMIPVAAVLAGLAVLDMLRPNLEFHAVLSLVITATGALWVAVGVWRYVPGRVGLLLLAAATLNLAAMVAWLAPVLAGGDAPLAQPSIADAGWLIASPLLAAALLYALTRREPPRFVVLDVVTLAAALGLVAGVGADRARLRREHGDDSRCRSRRSATSSSTS